MKIEFQLGLMDAVRLHDALNAAVEYQGDRDGLLGYLRGVVAAALKGAERTYEDALTAPNAAEIEMARSHQRLDAIKALRERTGCDLMAAKAAMDKAVPWVVDKTKPM